MTSKHFANTGQVLQLFVAVVGTVIAGINAYPSIAAIDLFAMWPIVFYLLLIISALTLATKLQPLAQTTHVMTKEVQPSAKEIQPPPEKVLYLFPRFPGVEGVTWIKGEIGGLAFKMKPGERRTFATAVNQLTLVLHQIYKSPDGQPYADMTVEAFVNQLLIGTDVKINGNHQFSVPAAATSTDVDSVVVSLSFSLSFIDANFIRVDHINEHSREVDVTVIRCHGLG